MTLIRPARDADAHALIALIGDVYREYHGCVLDVDGEMPDLRAIASAYDQVGGQFWVAEAEGVAVGCCGMADAAARPGGGRGQELHRLYVAARARRTGLAGRFLDLVEAAARERRGRFVELWSDCRFVTAHGFYHRRGYVQQPEIRMLGDLSHTAEYHFLKWLPQAG